MSPVTITIQQRTAGNHNRRDSSEFMIDLNLETLACLKIRLSDTLRQFISVTMDDTYIDPHKIVIEFTLGYASLSEIANAVEKTLAHSGVKTLVLV